MASTFIEPYELAVVVTLLSSFMLVFKEDFKSMELAYFAITS